VTSGDFEGLQVTARDFLRLQGTSGGCKKASRDFDRLHLLRATP